MSLKARLTFIVLLAALVFTLPAAAGAIGTASVSGLVYDSQTELPVANQLITIAGDVDGVDTETDANGEYLVEGLLPGTYLFEVIGLPAYDITYVVADLVEGENIVDIALDPIFPMAKGRLTDGTNPIVDGTVGTWTWDKYEQAWMEGESWAWTDEDGYWSMFGHSGVYRFGFWAEGFREEFYDNKSDINLAKNITIVQSVSTPKAVDFGTVVLAPSVAGVSGRLTDGTDPIADADIYLYEVGNEEPVDYAMTASDGTFIFYDLMPGTDYQCVFPGGEVTNWDTDTTTTWRGTQSPEFSYAGTPVVLDADMVAEPAVVSMSGTVTDADTLLPLSGVPVDVYLVDATENYVTTCYTDFDGVWRAYDVEPGTYVVRYTGRDAQVMDDGSTETYYLPVDSGFVAVPGPGALSVDFALTYAVQVSGYVTRVSDDKAVQGMNVTAFSYDPEYGDYYTRAWGISDATGRYEIGGLNDEDVFIGTEGGAQMIDADVVPLDPYYDPSYWNDGSWVSSISDAATFTVDADWAGAEQNADIEVTPMTPLAKGRVKAGTTPLDGVVVDAYADFDGMWDIYTSAETTADGTFAVYAPAPATAQALAGTHFKLAFSVDEGYFVEYYNNKRTLAEATPLTFGANVGDIVMDPYVALSTRAAGTSRYGTAVDVAKKLTHGFQGVSHVILASGTSAADPLAAAGLTWAYDGAPMLLTSATSVPAETISALKQIVAINGPVTVHIVGGTSVVPDARYADIKAQVGAANVVSLSSGKADRIAGANRYGTAVAIAERMRAVRPDMPQMVLIANGAQEAKFVDALALSTVAANTGAPILTVGPTSVPAETAAEIARLGVSPSQIYIAGGPATVAESVRTALKVPAANRLAGPNRYETAINVARWAIDRELLRGDSCGIAASIPDALTGGAAVGAQGGVLLLTTPTALNAATATYLEEIAPDLASTGGQPARCYIFGGTSSVSDATRREIDSILNVF